MTKAEAARAALKAALDGRAAQQGAALPGLFRNEPLARAFEDRGAAGRLFVNLVDGRFLPLGEEVGGDGGGEEEFDVEVRIEIVVQISRAADRDAAFDAILEDLGAFVTEQNESGAPLGGACDEIRVGVPDLVSLSLSGLPGVKSGEVPLYLLVSAETFIS